MTLIEECIEALGSNIVILSDKQTHGYFEELSGKFPITSWARIDWDKYVIKRLLMRLMI
ncbi:CDI toxin immunity protein [Virgibacillus sp. 6R]|uniref:CDI toxin immunity protein n=1 Tax=Metabacillus sp. 22489 TaxID=3453928 RepID=UPI002103A1B8